MNVVVAVLWRPQPGRVAAHDYVVRHCASALPDATLVEVDTDHFSFNRAAARNKGVLEAEKLGADVVVLLDADCVIEPLSGMMDAAAAAYVDDGMHMPFRRQQYLTQEETSQLFEGTIPVPKGAGPGNGGCFVVRPSRYWEAGGSDERFSGWGCEDEQLYAAAATLIGLVRHEGRALSLWHPSCRDVGSLRHRPNVLLAGRYWKALHRPGKMREIIAERFGGSVASA